MARRGNQHGRGVDKARQPSFRRRGPAPGRARLGSDRPSGRALRPRGTEAGRRAAPVPVSRGPRGPSRRGGCPFGVLTFAGLGGLAIEELGRSVVGKPRVITLRNHDLVLVDIPRPAIHRLRDVRIAEDVFGMLGPTDPIRPGRAGADVSRAVTRQGVLDALGLKNSLSQRGKRGATTFACFVKQAGVSRVRRQDVAAGLAARLSALFPRWRPADPTRSTKVKP